MDEPMVKGRKCYHDEWLNAMYKVLTLVLVYDFLVTHRLAYMHGRLRHSNDRLMVVYGILNNSERPNGVIAFSGVAI